MTDVKDYGKFFTWDMLSHGVKEVEVPPGQYKMKEKIPHPRPGWGQVWSEWDRQHIIQTTVISGVLLTDEGHYEGEYYDKRLKILRLVRIPEEIVK